jgi:hypothetical protein
LPERPDLQESFSWLIKAGCNSDDLERALFWVVVNFHLSAGTAPKEIKDFFVLVDGILPKLQELRPTLDALLNWRSQNKPVPGFDLYLDLLDYLFPHLHVSQQRNRILPIPELLNHLDILLTAIQAAYKTDARQVAAHAATVPEVLLIEYVRHSTRSTSQEIEEITFQLREPQELAFEAYGMPGLQGRKYNAETWARRYRRFKEADPKMLEIIVAIVEDFLARKSRGEPISLIPFFNDSYVSSLRSEI